MYRLYTKCASASRGKRESPFRRPFAIGLGRAVGGREALYISFPEPLLLVRFSDLKVAEEIEDSGFYHFSFSLKL